MIVRSVVVLPLPLRPTTHTVSPAPTSSETPRRISLASIARALALDPELLLLDEPFEGLSPAIIPALAESLAAITRLGMSLVIAESNIHHVPAWTRRLYVIERGEVIFAGTPDDARRDTAVLRVIGGKAS